MALFRSWASAWPRGTCFDRATAAHTFPGVGTGSVSTMARARRLKGAPAPLVMKTPDRFRARAHSLVSSPPRSAWLDAVLLRAFAGIGERGDFVPRHLALKIVWLQTLLDDPHSAAVENLADVSVRVRLAPRIRFRAPIVASASERDGRGH